MKVGRRRASTYGAREGVESRLTEVGRCRVFALEQFPMASALWQLH
jgi:hypothetical protein